MVNRVALQGLYKSYPEDLTVFEKCYPWVLMIASLYEDSKEFQKAAEFLHLHDKALLNKVAFRALRRKLWPCILRICTITTIGKAKKRMKNELPSSET